MRAVKKTSITWGLVNVPVKIIKATETNDIELHQHHADCGGRIGYTRVCKDCEAVVDFADIVKGAEYGDDAVMLSAEELSELRSEQDSGVEVELFCDQSEVDPVLFDSTYYLEPDKSANSYAVLRNALAESRRVGIVRLALRDRAAMGVLRPWGDILVVHTLHWADEVRDPSQVNVGHPKPVPEALMDNVRSLLDSMTAKFEPERFTNSYVERLSELIEAKATGGEVSFASPAAAPSSDDVSELLALLEASVNRRKGA